MKNSWKKVVAMMIAAALCVSCGVTGFSEDIQTDENTEIVEVVEAQNQEEPQQEEAPVQEPAPAPEPVQEPEPVKEPDPAPVKEPEPVPEAPKAEEPKNEPEAPKNEAPKQEEEIKADQQTEEKIDEKAEVPEQKIEESAEQKKEDIKADEAKKEEEIKAETKNEESKEESKSEEPKAEEPKAEESKEEPKAEEKPAEQPTVPAAVKVEQPVEDAPAADVVVKENITVCIEWEDEDDALGLRPQTRAVTLNGSDGQTYSATLSEKDGWQHTFADLTTQRGAEVIYYSVDADDAADYDKDVRGLTVTYTCTAQPVAEEEPIIDEQPVADEQPAADDENLIDDQMDGDTAELPEGNIPTVTETEDGTVIDMGETAEAPVEGEEANADKPEEDGELDEDFTLPEEGELPEEDFSTLQVVIGEPQYDGDVMTLRATLIGFDNIDYALQWQFSTDDATWTDVSGATGDTLVVQLDESNAGCYWRVSAEVFGWKTLPTEQAAQE